MVCEHFNKHLPKLRLLRHDIQPAYDLLYVKGTNNKNLDSKFM